MKGFRVVFKDRGVVSVEDFEVEELQPGQVLVRTLYTLISPGTETAFLLGLPNTPRVFPQYPGYSNVGLVEATSGNAKGFKLGDLVASPSKHSSLVVQSVDNIFRIPREVPPKEAVFFYISAIALQAVRKSGLEIGETAVVLGLGLVGQLTAQLLRIGGAIPIIGVDLYDYRLKTARELAVDYTVNPSKTSLVGEVNRITEGRGVHLVIEATGNPEAVNLAFKLAGRRGRVILLGSTRGLSTVNFYTEIHRKGLTVIGAHNSIRPRFESSRGYWTIRDDVETVFKLLACKRLRVDKLATSTLDFRQASEAYRRLIEEKHRFISVILDWTSVEKPIG